jgi:hypothetical protein
MSDRYDPANWSPTAWKWFLYGYGRGVQSGIKIGYQAGHVDGEFAEAARKGPAVHVPDEIDAAFDHVRAVKAARRAETAHKPLTPAEIRERAAASWAAVEARIGGAA